MTPANKLIIVTIICHMLVIVGIAHTAVPFGFIEINFLAEVFNGNTGFSLTGSDTDRYNFASLVALIGHFVLVIACMAKGLKPVLAYSGFAISFVSFLILVVDMGIMKIDSFALFFGFPFLYSSVRTTLYFNRLGKLKKEGLIEG